MSSRPPPIRTVSTLPTHMLVLGELQEIFERFAVGYAHGFGNLRVAFEDVDDGRHGFALYVLGQLPDVVLAELEQKPTPIDKRVTVIPCRLLDALFLNCVHVLPRERHDLFERSLGAYPEAHRPALASATP